MYMTDREKKTATIITGTGLALATVVILVWGLVGCGGAAAPREAGGSGPTTAAPSVGGDGTGATGPGPAPATAGTPAGSGGGNGGGAPSGGQGGGQNGGGTGGTGGQGGTGNQGGTGGGAGGGQADGDGDPVLEPAAKDCVAYDPAALAVVDAGASGWRVSSAGHSIALLDTESDANEALKVARRWTHTCYIGRGNDRPNHSRYVKRYWEGPSDLPLGLAPAGSCSTYDPTKLAIRSAGDAGWQVVSGDNSLLLLDTAADAERARLVAAGRHAVCFIGRNNTRPDHYRYLFEYWTG